MILQNALTTLESSGLLRLAQAEPELEYIFRHNLVQDAAYASLLKADRRQLHYIVGEALERLYPEQEEELAPRLAQHFLEVGDQDRALKYFTLAGDAAARVYANAEAVMHYTRALEIARRAGGNLQHLYMQRGKALELSVRYDEAMRNYKEMEALALERGDRGLELASLMARATLRSTPSPWHDQERAEALSAQALALAQELGDRAAEAKILWTLLLLYRYGQRAQEAVEYGERSLEIARELNLREQMAFTLNDLARARDTLGQLQRAQAERAAARELWRALDNRPMLTDNLTSSGMGHYLLGELEQARQAIGEASRISHGIGNLWGIGLSRSMSACVLYECGEYGQAIAAVEAVIQLAERIGMRVVLAGERAELVWLYAMVGDKTRAYELARQARANAGEQLPSHFRAWALATLARLEIRRGNLAQAEADLRENYASLDLRQLELPTPSITPLVDGELALARQDYGRAIAVVDELMIRLNNFGVRVYVPHALLIKAKARLAQGQTEAAYAALAEARALDEVIGLRRALWPILATLSQIERQHGNGAQANAWRQQACDILAAIAEGCPAELRASFLNEPEVRQVIDDVT
jgi:tetratricopeptide (TPR) repeat protein